MDVRMRENHGSRVVSIGVLRHNRVNSGHSKAWVRRETGESQRILPNAVAVDDAGVPDGSPPMSKHRQEQIQMITMVKGSATPTAPPIVNAKADSRFASACSSFPDMLLLHRAPAP
jgi:hypothetical protein